MGNITLRGAFKWLSLGFGLANCYQQSTKKHIKEKNYKKANMYFFCLSAYDSETRNATFFDSRDNAFLLSGQLPAFHDVPVVLTRTGGAGNLKTVELHVGCAMFLPTLRQLIMVALLSRV